MVKNSNQILYDPGTGFLDVYNVGNTDLEGLSGGQLGALYMKMLSKRLLVYKCLLSNYSVPASFQPQGTEQDRPAPALLEKALM